MREAGHRPPGDGRATAGAGGVAPTAETIRRPPTPSSKETISLSRQAEVTGVTAVS